MVLSEVLSTKSGKKVVCAMRIICTITANGLAVPRDIKLSLMDRNING